MLIINPQNYKFPLNLFLSYLKRVSSRGLIIYFNKLPTYISDVYYLHNLNDNSYQYLLIDAENEIVSIYCSDVWKYCVNQISFFAKQVDDKSFFIIFDRSFNILQCYVYHSSKFYNINSQNYNIVKKRLSQYLSIDMNDIFNEISNIFEAKQTIMNL